MRAFTGYQWTEGYNYSAQRWMTPEERAAQDKARTAEAARQAEVQAEVKAGVRCPTCREPVLSMTAPSGKVYIRCGNRRCRYTAVKA